MNLRKTFLYILIASVAVCAVMGIGVILFGSFGDVEEKILATTFTITCTSILGLACGAYYESKGAKGLPFSGIGLAFLAAILVNIEIWGRSFTGDTFARTTVTATVLAATCGLLSLISLATLDRRFAWSRYLAIFAAVVLDALLLFLLWFVPEGDSEFISRSIGVLSIVIASVTVVTPVFHKLSRTTIAINEIDAEISELKARLAELEKRKAELTHIDGE